MTGRRIGNDCIVLYLLPVLNPKSYDGGRHGARVLEIGIEYAAGVLNPTSGPNIGGLGPSYASHRT